MVEHVNLMGHEAVADAGYRMAHAAERISQAASTIQAAAEMVGRSVEILQQALAETAQRFEVNIAAAQENTAGLGWARGGRLDAKSPSPAPDHAPEPRA